MPSDMNVHDIGQKAGCMWTLVHNTVYPAVTLLEGRNNCGCCELMSLCVGHPDTSVTPCTPLHWSHRTHMFQGLSVQGGSNLRLGSPLRWPRGTRVSAGQLPASTLTRTQVLSCTACGRPMSQRPNPGLRLTCPRVFASKTHVGWLWT